MEYKIVVIGSGPGGYTAAIRAAQLGAKVAIIEKDLIGGICTNWGCTPSKAMITSAKYAKMVRESEHYGVEHNGITNIDFQKVAARRDVIMQRSREDIKELLEYWKVEIIQGYGEINDNNHVKVGDKILETENIIIATGSQPLIPKFLNQEDPSIINSNKLITIKELPKELTIVGGGIIGLEFSTLFAQLGTKVRIIELLDRCVSMMCPEVSGYIEEELKKLGVKVLTDNKVLSINNGVIKVQDTKTNEEEEIRSDMNLIAIGRKAVMNSPEFDRLGISYNPKGVDVDDSMRTNIENIYAVGDATGKSILAHVAMQQGLTAAENIMGMDTKMDYSVIPAVVYSIPEISSVGTVPEDLAGIKVVKFPFTTNLRAMIEEHDKGFVKMWIKEDLKSIVAVQIVHENAGELIQYYADIIKNNIKLEDIINTIHAHPTYSEVVRNSLEFVLGVSTSYFE